MPAGRKYKPYPKKGTRRYQTAKGQAYRNKMRAYNKVAKKKNRNNFRPFVETMTRTVDGRTPQHYKFDNVTGAAAVAPSAQMGINNANDGTGAHFAVPQDFSVVIPSAFSNVWVRGNKNGEYQGRVLKPNWLSCKCELDWSAKVKDSEHASLTGIDDNWWCIQGWAKNSVFKQVGDVASLPTTNDTIGAQMAQIVGKCCHASGVNGDPLAFISKRKDIIILKKFRIKPNLNNRYVAGVATLATHDAKPTNVMVFALPTVLSFSWKFGRKQLIREGADDKGIIADSYIPFVSFFNRNLSAKAHEVTPDLFSSSKIYYTDM